MKKCFFLGFFLRQVCHIAISWSRISPSGRIRNWNWNHLRYCLFSAQYGSVPTCTYIKIHYKGVLESGVLARWRSRKDPSLLPWAFTVTGRRWVWGGGTGGGAKPGKRGREGQLNVSQAQTNSSTDHFHYICTRWGLETKVTLHIWEGGRKGQGEEKTEECPLMMTEKLSRLVPWMLFSNQIFALE